MSDYNISDQTLESYKLIFESSLDAILLTHPDGTIFYANSATEELYGYTQKEICDLGRRGIVDTNDPNLQVILDERARLGKSKGELTLIKKDGSKFPGEVSTSIYTDKKSNINTFMTIRDITKRKENEIITQNLLNTEQLLTEELTTSNEKLLSTTEELQVTNQLLLQQEEKQLSIYNELQESHKKLNKTLEELSKSESLLSSITNLSSDIIYVKDRQSRWIFVNPALEKFVGKNSADLLGKNDLEIYSNPEIAKTILKNDSTIMDSGKEVILEEVVETPEGIRSFISVKTPRFNENGQVIGIVGISHDITERKYAEQKNQKLLEQEQQLTEELQTSNEELQAITEEFQVTNEELHQQEEKLLQTYNELKTSEERFRNIIETSQDAYMRTDRKGNIIMASPSAARMYRFDSNLDMIGTSTHSYFKTSEDRDYAIEELKQHSKFIDYEVEARRNDGTFFWVSQNAQYYYDNHGKIKGSETFVRDISIRKQAEEALNQSEKLLNDIINGFPSPIFVKDIDGRFLTVNSKFEELLGVKNKELKGKTDYDIITRELAEIYRVNDQKVLDEGKAIRLEEEADLVDGHHTFIANKFPIFDSKGKPYGVGSISTDITELKKIEENLKESEERLRLAQNLGNVGIWDWNTITDELHFTPELEQLYGLVPGTIKTYEDWRQLTHPDDIEKIETERDNKIAKNQPFDLEFRIFHNSGEIHWLSAKGGAIYNDEGDILRVLGINTDITERINHEIELERSNEELERFAYVSSHDLQEPLRMVTLYTQLLERRYKDNLDSDANDFIEYIVEGANRMRQLIDDLLEYSRVTNQAKEFEKVNLEKILDVVLHNFTMTIVDNNVLISHDPLPIVFADKNQMVQVFQNLISNAIKFHGRNPPEINISVQKDKNEWIFVVSDNGIGIKPEHQIQIFEVFKRLHTREQHPGTGIGLSITQKIITHHGGRIWVESELGQGSTFYFTIPER